MVAATGNGQGVQEDVFVPAGLGGLTLSQSLPLMGPERFDPGAELARWSPSNTMTFPRQNRSPRIRRDVTLRSRWSEQPVAPHHVLKTERLPLVGGNALGHGSDQKLSSGQSRYRRA